MPHSPLRTFSLLCTLLTILQAQEISMDLLGPQSLLLHQNQLNLAGLPHWRLRSPLPFVPNQAGFLYAFWIDICPLKCTQCLQTELLKRYIHLTNIIFSVCQDRGSLEQTIHLSRENIRDCVQCTVYRSPFFSIYPIKLTGNECSSVSKGKSLKPFLFSSHQTFIRPLILLLMTMLAYRKGQETALQIQVGFPRAKSLSS